jgi:predicted transcriptional regulator
MYPSDFSTKQIHMTIATELLKQIDELAKRDFTTRSSIFRSALVKYVRKPLTMAKLEADPGRDVELELFLQNLDKEEDA